MEEKRYLYNTLYTCTALELEHSKAEEVVTELFEYWMNEPGELPESYFPEIESEGLARVVAKEGGPRGVRANVVCPGFVRTPLVDKQIPEQSKALGISEAEVVKNVMLRETVDGEFTTVEDVANTVAFLAGFESNALTGQSVIVSHGWAMQ